MLWLLRKRRVLFAIFLVALVYFLVATVGTKRRVAEEDVNNKLDVNLLELIDSEDDVASNSDVRAASCKNSVQGKLLIADDRGHVCERSDLNVADGCCRPDAPSTQLHVCRDCSTDDSGCCTVYEHCVSCCMRPESAAVLRRSLDSRLQPAAAAAAAAASGSNGTTSGTGDGSNNVNKVYALVRSRFDLCLTRCRTSSLSVRHENAYADSARKHCFGAADATALDDV